MRRPPVLVRACDVRVLCMGVSRSLFVRLSAIIDCTTSRTIGNYLTRVMSWEPKVKKRRSGTESRQRTEKINLRVLPAERRALRVLADRAGHQSVQGWILETIAPHLDGVGPSEIRP